MSAATVGGFAALVLAGMMGMDLLAQALHDVRPVETDPGRAEAIHHQYTEELMMRLEQQAHRDPSAATAMREVGSGRIFGIRNLVSRAGADFAAVRVSRPCPTVLLTGEIYVRSEAFANDFVAQKLEAQGIRVRLTPASEWLDYVRHLVDLRSRAGALRVTSLLQKRLQRQLHDAMARHLQWPPLLRAGQTIAFAGNYVDRALQGEAILTVGGAIAEWRHGQLDGVVNVGPLECMPSKIAESQFIRIAEDEGLLSTTLSLDGDPLERGALDNFVFEVKSHFEERDPQRAGHIRGRHHAMTT